eukprot:m.339295 g.339295  ORF g.339295 m.339295 type:complete len:214 (-) comp18737_c0_seq1:88-729(-)
MPKVLAAGDAQAMVRAYMQEQNRPHSAITVFQNLQQQVGKTQTTQILTKLAKEQFLVEKEYGKAKVYLLNQADQKEVPQEELATLDQEIENKKLKGKNLRDSCVKLASELDSLTGSLTNTIASKKLSDLKEENSDLSARIKKIEESGDLVSKEEQEKVEKNYTKHITEWRKRKKYMKNIEDTVMESYPKKRKQLQDDMGVETDEAAGIDISDF